MEEKEVDYKEEEKNGEVSISPESISEDEKNRKEALKKKQNKQLVWGIVLMISVIVIILLVPVIRDNFFYKFDHNGMTFQKRMLGQIAFYVTNLPLYSQSAVSTFGTGLAIEDIPKKQTGSYELALRQNPKDLDYIKVNLDVNNITFIKANTVYATYNSSDPICQHNIIAAADLARFLINFGGLDAKGAVMDKDYSDAKKIPYITCENSPDNTVIKIIAGNETKISRINRNCYELMYANCDVQSVMNKFTLILAEGYTNTYVKGK